MVQFAAISCTVNDSALIFIFVSLLVGLSTFAGEYRDFAFGTGLGQGIGFGLGSWLLLGIFQGISSETVRDDQRLIPNQGIRRSALNGFVLGLVSVVIVGLIGTLTIVLNHELLEIAGGNQPGGDIWLLAFQQVGPNTLLLMAAAAGLSVALLNGWLACLRHYTLRFLLWQNRSMPWNFVQFLDTASRCILLRKEGGGYRFIHRQFQVYIASLATSPPPLQEASKQEQLIRSQGYCACGYQDDRLEGRFCPRCGKTKGHTGTSTG